MDLGLHFGQPAPSPVVDEGSNQPDEQADRHTETAEYAQAVDQVPPELRNLRGMILTESRISTVADKERRIAGDFGMRVEKADQSRIWRKISRVEQEAWIKPQDAPQFGRIVIQELRQALLGALRVRLLYGYDSRR